MSVDKVLRVFKILRFYRINSPDNNMRKDWNGNLEKVFQNSRKKAQVYN